MKQENFEDEQVSFKIEDDTFTPQIINENDVVNEQCSSLLDQIENDRIINPEQDEDEPNRQPRHRNKGLSISDIPYNIFNQEHYEGPEAIDLLKQEGYDDEYKQTTNFGCLSLEKFKNDHDRMPSENLSHNSFYGRNEDDGGEIQLIVSPMKLTRFEAESENSADRNESLGYNKSQELKELENYKNSTFDLNRVLNTEKSMERNMERQQMTDRYSHVAVHSKPKQLKFNLDDAQRSRSRQGFDRGLHTNRDTNKSDSSYIPTFSRNDYEDYMHGGNSPTENYILSTGRLSYLKNGPSAMASRDVIKEFIEREPQKINDMIGPYRQQLEDLVNKIQELNKIYDQKQQFYNECLQDKIQTEKEGRIINECLDETFREQESATKNLADLRETIAQKREDLKDYKQSLTDLIALFSQTRDKFNSEIAKSKNEYDQLVQSLDKSNTDLTNK